MALVCKLGEPRLETAEMGNQDEMAQETRRTTRLEPPDKWRAVQTGKDMQLQPFSIDKELLPPPDAQCTGQDYALFCLVSLSWLCLTQPWFFISLYCRPVKLAAHGLNMSCTGHAHPSSAKKKNIAIHHDPARDTIEFDTHALLSCFPSSLPCNFWCRRNCNFSCLGLGWVNFATVCVRSFISKYKGETR